MKYVVFYFSPTGGTKTVADLITNQTGAVIQELTTPSMDVSLDSDTLAFFCIPVYAGRIPAPMYDRMKCVKGNNTPCVPVAVYGNRAVDDALLEMSDLAAKYGFRTVGGIEMIAPHSIDPSIAYDRPDQSDRAKLSDYIAKLMATESFKDVKMPGDPNYAKRKMKDFPIYPKASRKDCIGCGICYKYCPAEAIKAKRMKTIKRKCINCMRCINICSTQTRHIPKATELATHLMLKATCSKRREPKFYL